jgi:hypothetical protein
LHSRTPECAARLTCESRSYSLPGKRENPQAKK